MCARAHDYLQMQKHVGSSGWGMKGAERTQLLPLTELEGERPREVVGEEVELEEGPQAA